MVCLKHEKNIVFSFKTYNDEKIQPPSQKKKKKNTLEKLMYGIQ